MKSKFEEKSFNGLCDVCGKETKVVVCASSMGATNYQYCEECLHKGLEPYNDMVAYISLAGKFPEEINPQYVEYIRAILKELGKTEDKFIADCAKCNEEFKQWCDGMNEQEENESEIIE